MRGVDTFLCMKWHQEVIAELIALEFMNFYEVECKLWEYELSGYFLAQFICDGTSVKADWSSCTYGRTPNAIDISQGSLTCPSYTDTGPPFLNGASDTPPHLVAFYDTQGIRRTYSRLKPQAFSRGWKPIKKCRSTQKLWSAKGKDCGSVAWFNPCLGKMAVSWNRWLDGHVKEPYKMSTATFTPESRPTPDQFLWLGRVWSCENLPHNLLHFPEDH